MRKTMVVLALALTLGSTVLSRSAFAFGLGHFGPGLGLATHFGPGFGLAHFGGGTLGIGPRFGGGQFGPRFGGLGPHFGDSYFGRGGYAGYAYGGGPRYGSYGYAFRRPYFSDYGYAGGPIDVISGYASGPYDDGYSADDAYDDVYETGGRPYDGYAYRPPSYSGGTYYATGGENPRHLRRRATYRRHQ